MSDNANSASPPDTPTVTAATKPFALSREQDDTAALLERLLGPAISERYVDFLKLASGKTDLAVTIPLAGHALREIESSIRTILAATMEFELANDPAARDIADRLAKAKRAFDLPEEVISAGLNALKPKDSHTTQIRKIAERLGLDPQGDIAIAWIRLSKAAEQAHERSFHRALRVDDEFRQQFQAPFEVVVRGLAIALEPRFSAMTARAEELAAMTPVSRAAKLFAKEMPGSLPLQWHFYQVLRDPAWIAPLIDRGLVAAPVRETLLDARFRQWPVGIFLNRMAKLHDGKTPPLVAKALRVVEGSSHPDVRRQGIDIVAELPCADAAKVTDVVVSWLGPDTRNDIFVAPQKIIKTLAEGGEVQAAITVAGAAYQLIDEDGSIATLHAQNMYEHFLAGTVEVLVATAPVAALALFTSLLQRGMEINRRWIPEPPQDYSHITPHPIAGNEMRTYEPYNALILAVRDTLTAAVRAEPQHAEARLKEAFNRGPKLFKRIALHGLSKSAAALPALCTEWLTDPELIGEDWCADEYAELALAAFPTLPPEAQALILTHIDRMPDQYRASWAARVEAHRNRAPTLEELREYRDSTFRDAVWKWRDVLPDDRKAQLAAIVREFGEADAWREGLFPTETSPLEEADIANRTIPEIVLFLQSWKPLPDQQKLTVTALGNQLRQAVEKEPARFIESADRFGGLAPIYIRRLLEGLANSIRNKGAVTWPPLLSLFETSIGRAKIESIAAKEGDGDDPSWIWALESAAEILRHTLGQGVKGIAHEHAHRIVSIIQGLLSVAPQVPESENFEESFEKHTYFTASQSLRGAAVELCIMVLFWESKHEGSRVFKTPRQALTALPEIRALLDTQLDDASPSGRIPRAVIGRWMQWLTYFGKDWLAERLPAIFPAADEALRLAAWRAHLLNDGGPVIDFAPQMLDLYMAEVARMAMRRAEASEQVREEVEARTRRLGEYILVNYLEGVAPEGLMQAFWSASPGRVRQHVIWFLGNHLERTPEQLSDDARSRAVHYWQTRLDTARSASNKEPFRKEIGAIATWCRHDNIPADWLLTQMMIALKADFAPNSGYTVVEWMAKHIEEDTARIVEAFELTVRNKHSDHWTYIAHKDAVRVILRTGMASPDPEVLERSKALISYLASIGENEYLALLNAPPNALH